MYINISFNLCDPKGSHPVNMLQNIDFR